jgi:hypothetical protein
LAKGCTPEAEPNDSAWTVPRTAATAAVELLDPHVAERHGVAAAVVLQPDVAVEAACAARAGEVVDEHAVEVDPQALALDEQLERVPLPGRVERGVAGRGVGGLEPVDRAGGAVGRVGGVDLHLVAARHRRRRVVGGGKPRKTPELSSPSARQSSLSE